MQLGLRIDHPLDYQVDSEGGWVMPVVQVPGLGRRRSWSRLCGSLWFVCAGVERASREGSSYIYTSSTLTSRWHQRGQALWRTTGPPINLATFLFSILDSKRRLGTFKVFFGLILLILFSFLMALFFDWKVVRVLMVVGLSSPLSKSSFIYLFLVFLHPKRSIGLKPRVRFFECVFFIYQQPLKLKPVSRT